MDILLDQEHVIDQDFNDCNLSLRDVIDISNLTSEDLLKTSNLDLELLNNPQFEVGQMMMNSDEIDCVAKELIEDVIASISNTKNNLGCRNATKSCVIDISNFTAKDFFDSQNFNFDSEFKSTGSLDLKLVNLPVQVEEERKLVVFKPVAVSPKEVTVIPKSSPSQHKSSPHIERRMPKFNKLSKFISELRDFEAQLVNVSISKNDKVNSDRKRKQDVKSCIKIDLDTGFYSEELARNAKKPRQVSSKHKKVLKVDPQDSLEFVDELGFENSTKPEIDIFPISKSADDSDKDFETTKKVSPLRCSYCQKFFITIAGLSTHIKHCSKFAKKLSDIIDESCSFKEFQNSSKSFKMSCQQPGR